MGDETVLERILNGDEDPKDLPLALLQKITDDFSDDRKIGQGGFGEVYKGVYNGEELAVKLFYDVPAVDNKQFENEFFKLLRIRHPNIVQLLGYCYETQCKYVEHNGELRFAKHISRILCFEYLQGGSLDKYLNEEPRDHDWPTRYNIIEGTCEGLNFLHGGCGSQILHLDLKPANILLDKYMGAKVADFGLSRFFSKTHTHVTSTTTGTLDYMPPEFRFKNQISPKNDVYSLGIIIIEIMAGRRGYSEFRAMDDTTPFLEQVITNWRERINATTSPFPLAELDQVETCIKIAIKCVDPERKNRPTVAEILDTMQETERKFLEEWRNHAGFLVGQSLPTPTKSQLRGGSGGKVVDIKEAPWRLHSVTISYQGLIDAFSFSYIDQSGKKQRAGPWGEELSYHKTETIRFGPSEFVEEVSGAYRSHCENILVMSLTFITNIRTYGPFGNSHCQNVEATPFRFMADEGSCIVGFHGRSGRHLYSIGVYMYPSNKTTARALSAPVILKGQGSTYLDNDMLGIEPLELRFDEEMSWSVKLTNKTKACFAFSIERPSKQYTIQPDRGIVTPGCSAFLVQIAVTAPQVTQNADKLIVRSTKVLEGLRVEDITKDIFHEVAGKVVYEVDLMVVYEPTKPPKNCKSREDTNMPAEEVPKAKKRKIVGPASEKGKLVSSENAEASLVRYKDINSSTRGQRTEQTEQYKFYPPQSFSHHYPTNTIYLGKGSRAVDVARGAMGSLLDKLGKLVNEDYNLESSMKRDIQSFSEDLAIIHKDLPKLEKLDGVKFWVDEVRELSYHIEDMVDSFMVRVEPDSSSSGFRELLHEGLKFLENDKTTHRQIGDVIRDIKNKVQAVADRQKKYNFSVNNVVADPTVKAIDPRMAIYISETQLVGIEARTDELIRLFEGDDVSKEELTIVSIVGLGGLGKTTLARAVYDKLKTQYHCRAFVSVGQNPDVKKVLMNILSALGNKFNDLEVPLFIDELQKFLVDKRYFIVIDDIWDSEAWGCIKYAFPRNNHGSRLITTTRIELVARDCCKVESKYVYRMKPLSEEDSRRLFLRRTFGPGKDCADTPRKEEISIHILERCCGMPLAINSIASLLAGKFESTWEYMWKSLRSMMEGDDLEMMKLILDRSYIHLPDHLKTCLLYVCMYLEDREIDKDDLLKKWVAEGFVHVSRNSGLDVVDVAEKYFKELINMCMLQPGKISYNNEVLSCRVHYIILDLLRSKSSKENFIHVIDGSKDETGEIRRVSVHRNDIEDTAILETINKVSLSHVRSVLLYRSSLVTCFLECKYVRVLHLEHQGIGGNIDLTGISRLFLLRYLKVASRSGIELKLPYQIGELQQLETIDLDGVKVRNYPSDIVSLPQLSHLSLTGSVLPDGIDRLKSLLTLVGVDVFNSSVENIKGLSKLTNLRKLEISSILSSESVEKTTMDALHSSFCKLSANLRAFTLKRGLFFIPDVSDWSWISRTPFPRCSDIRELDLLGCMFERCPEWIGQLHGLYKFCISVRGEVAYGVSIVAGLPSLAYFNLGICVTGEEEKEEIVVIPGTGRGAFRALKHLIFHCGKASLTFEAGAMPKLEKLSILFRYHMTPQLLPVGIQHLPAGTLKQISLHVDDDGGQVEGSQPLTNDEWSDYLGSREYEDYSRKRTSWLGPMLKRAFKQHHPGAKIIIWVGMDKYIGEDENKYFEGVDNEEDYYNEDDEATSIKGSSLKDAVANLCFEMSNMRIQ